MALNKVYSGDIYVVGLGPGDPLDLPAVNLSLLRSGMPVYLRTACHPVVSFLEREGISYRTFDDLYQNAKSFDDVYLEIADMLLKLAAVNNCPVVYGVPGHPLVGETTVRHLYEGAGQDVRISLWPAPSFLANIYKLLKIDPFEGLLIFDGFLLSSCKRTMRSFSFPPDAGIIISQVYNRVLASEVKLTLMEQLSDTHPVYIIRGAGIPGEEKVRRIPLYELDRQTDLDHLTTVYVTPGSSLHKPVVQEHLDSLVKVMDKLLSPGGCPWDRRQTHQTLKECLIEETYEVIEAIDEENMHKLCEELGDLLLQVVFHSALAGKKGFFDLNDVMAGITKKLITRHPHVFGSVQVSGAEEVLVNWEQIKRLEKQQERKSLLDGVPPQLPALQRAQKVQNKASRVGFDWPEVSGALVKLEEELEELRTACRMKDQQEMHEELGDLLFSVVNVGRLLKIDTEDALRSSVKKFIERFRRMETLASSHSLQLEQLSLEEMDRLWDEVKKVEMERKK